MAEAEYLDNDVMIHCKDGPANLLPHGEVLVPSRLSLEGEDVVSKKDESKGIWNVPDTEATLTLPSHSPAFSLRDIPSHPSKDELPPPPLVETESLQLPKTKAAVSKEGTSAKLRSPPYPANPMPPRQSAPVSPKSAMILHPLKNKATRCEPSVVNKN